MQKRTRLQLAKIHSHVIGNITPLIISHIHYGVGGVKSVGGGGINRKHLGHFHRDSVEVSILKTDTRYGMCQFESSSDVLFTTMNHFESSKFLHVTFFGDS